MTQRIDYVQQSPEHFNKLIELNQLLEEGTVEATIRDLVVVRASQLNGCAFCLDMHVKRARIHGERELRLHHLGGWRASTLFDERERAALAWAEALTTLSDQGVPDAVYEQVRSALSEKEISDLSFCVVVINAWNRANVAFRTAPGSSDLAFGLDKAGLA